MSNEIAGTSAVGSDDRRCGKLFEALSKAQAEFKQIHKTNTNPYFKSKYAPLENIIEAVVPALSKYGLSVVQIPENDGVRATIKTVIGHSSGDQISGIMSMTPTKNDPQGMGSAYTYARRYSLAMMLNVAAEEDDDANAASVEQKKKKPATSYPNEKQEASEFEPLEDSASKVVETGVAKITQKTGKTKDGKEWKRYSIFGEGEKVYSTFSESFASLAKSAHEAGLEVAITHKQDQYNTIETIDILEPNGHG